MNLTLNNNTYFKPFTSSFISDSDKAKDDVKWYDSNNLSEPYWQLQMNVLPKQLCSKLIAGDIDHMLEQEVTQKIGSILPSVYQNRRVLSLRPCDWRIEKVGKIQKQLFPTIKDEDGNKSRLIVVIFLNNGVSNHDSLNPSRFVGGTNIWFKPRYIEIPSIRGSAIIFDNTLEFEMSEVVMGQKWVCVANVMCDILPHNFLLKCEEDLRRNEGMIDKMFKIHEEMANMKRGLMTRCFKNAFVKPICGLYQNFQFKHDPTYECCECCQSYVPVTSSVCIFCMDILTPVSYIIQQRLNKAWIAD